MKTNLGPTLRILLIGALSAPAAAAQETLFQLTSGVASDGHGFAVSGDGDVNGDGVPDFLIGAPSADVAAGPQNVGCVQVRSASTAAVLLAVLGEQANAGFGEAVDFIGDVDGDGFDVIAGAHPPGGRGGYASVVRRACGSVTAYGAGCPGSGGITPALAVDGCVAAGETVILSIEGGLPLGAAFLFLGTSQASVPAGGGCSLLVGAAIRPFGPTALDAKGGVSFPLALPAGTAGVVATFQAFLVDAALAQGFSTTQGSRSRSTERGASAHRSPAPNAQSRGPSDRTARRERRTPGKPSRARWYRPAAASRPTDRGGASHLTTDLA